MRDLKDKNNFLYRLVESFPDGILVYDEDFQIILLNKIALDLMGVKGQVSAYLDKNIFDLLNVSNVDEQYDLDLFRDLKDFEIRSIKFQENYLDIVGKSISDGMLLFVHNVTQTINSKNLALKNLIKGQESERERLAKEIHDGIGPSLSTIRLGLDGLSRKVDNEEIKNDLRKYATYLSEVAQEIRHISHDLMPPSLSDFGIKSALESLFSKIHQNSDVQIEAIINITDNKPELNQTQALNLYRITQEAIHNGIKHGMATVFEVSLFHQNEKLYLHIKNNGQLGIKKNSGIGIKNMHARMQSMGGKLRIRSNKNKNFRVEAILPLTR